MLKKPMVVLANNPGMPLNGAFFYIDLNLLPGIDDMS